jgi:hypothetical protein
VSDPVPCPRCGIGIVRLGSSSWTGSTGRRRCLWLDEPARCRRRDGAPGCALTWLEVQRLLLRAYRAPATQLPLFEEAAG